MPDSEVKPSVDKGDSFSAEIVVKFCYPQDMLSVDGLEYMLMLLWLPGFSMVGSSSGYCQ